MRDLIYTDEKGKQSSVPFNKAPKDVQIHFASEEIIPPVKRFLDWQAGESVREQRMKKIMEKKSVDTRKKDGKALSPALRKIMAGYYKK